MGSLISMRQFQYNHIEGEQKLVNEPSMVPAKASGPERNHSSFGLLCMWFANFVMVIEAKVRLGGLAKKTS